MTYQSQVSQRRIVRAVEHDVLDRLVRHLLTLPVLFFDRRSHGDLIQAIRHDVSAIKDIFAASTRMVLDGSLALGLIVAAASMSLPMTAVVLLVLSVVALPTAFIARASLKHSFRVRRRASGLYDALLQILRGIREVKIYNREEREAATATKLAREYFEISMEVFRRESLARVFLESMAGLIVVIVVVAGGLEVLKGNLMWPSLLAFLLTIRSLQGPLNSINSSYLEIQRHGAAATRISELLAVEFELADRRGAQTLDSPAERVMFDKVAFAYS